MPRPKKKVEHIPQTRGHTLYRQKSGLIVPGASTVAKIPEAHNSQTFLTRWANRLGLQGYDSDKYRDKLADVGTLTHEMCLEYFREQNYEPIQSEFSAWTIKEAERCFDKFLKWVSGHVLETRLVEASFTSELFPFGGTIDWYGLVDGVPTLLDYKTGKRIYSGYWYQLAGYNHLLFENGYPVDAIRVLRIGRNAEEGFDAPSRTNREILLQWEIFRRGLEIYWLQKQERAAA